MDHGFVGLSSEDVGGGDGETVGLGGGLLECGVDGVGWVESVVIDADVFGDGRVRGLWLSQDGGDKVL